MSTECPNDIIRPKLTPDAVLSLAREIIAETPGASWRQIHRAIVAKTGATISERVVYKWAAAYSWDVHLGRVKDKLSNCRDPIRQAKHFIVDMQAIAKACTEGQVIEGVAGKLIVRLGQTIDLLAPKTYDDLAKALDCVDRLLAQAHTARGLKFDGAKARLDQQAGPQLVRDQTGTGKVVLPEFGLSARRPPTNGNGSAGSNGHG